MKTDLKFDKIPRMLETRIADLYPFSCLLLLAISTLFSILMFGLNVECVIV